MGENRETKTVKIKEHEAVIKTYLTAGERRVLRNALLTEMKLDILGDTPNIKEISPEIIEKSENKTIEQVVVSFDSSSENIVERMLAIKSEEFDEIMTEVNKVAQGEAFEVKKKK